MHLCGDVPQATRIEVWPQVGQLLGVPGGDSGLSAE
jgi:hypothetical protein